jgi:hypothetical protein
LTADGERKARQVGWPRGPCAQWAWSRGIFSERSAVALPELRMEGIFSAGEVGRLAVWRCLSSTPNVELFVRHGGTFRCGARFVR